MRVNGLATEGKIPVSRAADAPGPAPASVIVKRNLLDESIVGQFVGELRVSPFALLPASLWQFGAWQFELAALAGYRAYGNPKACRNLLS
ncbi:hypothetical protein UFOVP1672_63 [uncultured Caudovirales phage]|uniref:Uncharacterized protein n=1 Tax=uncultured Caudovirales phage TaxID=2100421 RepID=A0A6J5S9M2_9CAUD|nr:hypothetical protein UFOVP988_1 [uncultured Caudovirales phage]CAB4210313.1 hypothetical protein UFOVP1425_1 [uncultured Caudovirales phage]CAB4223465.1 hypothetical protein UFOVP1672_63 [uncultured Caudovirales phage]